MIILMEDLMPLIVSMFQDNIEFNCIYKILNFYTLVGNLKIHTIFLGILRKIMLSREA
jgi:hypothetical protein